MYVAESTLANTINGGSDRKLNDLKPIRFWNWNCDCVISVVSKKKKNGDLAGNEANDIIAA